MIINKIIKKKNNIYKIIIDDNEFNLYEDVIIKNNLLYKKDISNELLKKIIIDNNYYDVYNKTINYIMKKIRCESEIKSYLDKFEIAMVDKQRILNDLKNIKLIDDIKYCKSYINDKVYLSKIGINKIKIDLINKNIPINIINDELNKIDISYMNDRLESILIKKIKNNKKYSNKILKEKLLNEFINLGYNKELILKIINSNLENDNEIAKKEFDKQYNILSRKYKDNELLLKLKQRLISKGFDINLINNFINEKK